MFLDQLFHLFSHRRIFLFELTDLDILKLAFLDNDEQIHVFFLGLLVFFREEDTFL